MNYIEFYRDAYRKLGNISPLYFDCGELCSKKCCNNNDKGMYLFPGEDVFLELFPHDYYIMPAGDLKLLKCTGTCSRDIRPLSCMIFPLFPFLYENGTLSVEFDPRAKGTCPLLFYDIKELELKKSFRKQIRHFFDKAKMEKEIYDYLRFITDELIVLKKFLL